MKKLIYIAVLVATIVGCASTQTKNESGNTSAVVGDTIRIANDSLEYEIIIIEPGFNQWLVGQQPRGYYEQFWLENRNILFVTEYNNRVIDPMRFDGNLYLQQIDYSRGTDYGYEVNYLLYNWFEFFQQRYNQKLR